MKPSSLRTPMLCLGLLALAACSKPQEQQQPPPPEVGVVTVQPQNVPLTKDLVGRLSAFRSADVRARVAGVLLKRTYKEGTDVKEGQLLFQIDPAPFKAALASAQGDLAAAQAAYANYHQIAQRYRGLSPQGYISKQDLDTAEANERSGAAQVKQAQASVQTAQINLGFTNVVSPISGRAGQQQVTEGALVGQGAVGTGASSSQTSSTTLLTTVDQLDPLYVNFTLSAGDYNQLQEAKAAGDISLNDQQQTAVKVSLPNGDAYNHDGTLDFSGATVDQSTGAINLRALLPNPERSLLPGQYVSLKVNLGEHHNVFLVPQQAVQRDTVGAYVMVVGKDGKVVRRDIDTNQVYEHNWVIYKGVQPGDQVIVSGLQVVKEGAPAKAQPWTPPQDNRSQGQAPANAASAKSAPQAAGQQ